MNINFTILIIIYFFFFENLRYFQFYSIFNFENFFFFQNKPHLVEPIDFENFVLKNKTLLQNDPQRELLLYPQDDVSVSYIFSAFNFLENISYKQKLLTLCDSNLKKQNKI